MWTFAPSELVSSTDFVRNFWEYSKSLKNSKIQKLWILKNNVLDMVVIPWKVYETIWDVVKSVFWDREITEERLNRLQWMSYQEILDKYTDKNWDSLFLEWDEVWSYLDAVCKSK